MMARDCAALPSPLAGEGAERSEAGEGSRGAGSDVHPSPGSSSLRSSEPPSPARGEGKKMPRPPKSNVDDSTVRADAVQCLADAAKHWAANGVTGLPPEAVWEQLWSLLDEAGVLKKKK